VIVSTRTLSPISLAHAMIHGKHGAEAGIIENSEM
jgi:hypothetical protein